MRIGVPLVPGTDPLAWGMLERFVAQADAELAVAGDARRLRVVRLAHEPGAVPLWGGGRVATDALYRERPAVDVLVLLGTGGPDGNPSAAQEALVAYMRTAREDAQHVVATGSGVGWCMAAGLTTGRRVMMNHLSPAVRARYDATLAAQMDPAHDGDLWTASDPPRLALLLLEFFAEMAGHELADRLLMRMPWLTPLISAFAPGAPGPDGGADEDDEDGEDMDPPRPGDAGGGMAQGGPVA